MSEKDEICKVLDDITDALATMTREQRIAWFRRTQYPRSLHFNMDCGTTIIQVRTRFDKSSSETITEKVGRILLK